MQELSFRFDTRLRDGGDLRVQWIAHDEAVAGATSMRDVNGRGLLWQQRAPESTLDIKEGLVQNYI